MSNNVYMAFQGDGYQTTIDYCKNVVRAQTRNMMKDGSIEAQIVDVMPGIGPFVRFKIYFNKRTIKSFIQFNVEVNHTYSFNKTGLKERIIQYISNWFKADTMIYPEFVNIGTKDFNSDVCRTISPYSIGFWKGLTGNYEFIQDRAQLNLDSFRYRIPSGYDEHGVPIPPDKKMEDWFNDVVDIGIRYKVLDNYALTDENREAYIREYKDLLTRTQGQGDEYYEGLAYLKETYNPNEYVNENIPQAFQELHTLYNEYFGYLLEPVYTEAKEYYVKIILPA